MLNFEIKGTSDNHLIILHGFMENLFIWEEMEAELLKKFKLIKIDLPGHGKSEIYSEIHTMELMAEKVNEVAEFLKIEKFHLLGHSMGGYVSLAFAEKFPEKLNSLTLFFSTYFADDEEKKELREKSTKAQNKIDSLRIGESGPFRNIISNNIFDKQEERYER